ncbi:ethylene-responsive transcription factor ERF017-like [Zingiber officinale]|uniref:AP2/ERF domain-containing protein n=1 Tax=Zingiber officinale TaxID=94328 RepID=A0A8J5LQM9_ZINOF|nr:ethylene-responsive transcription factor ERF017-like [Zingiber officinale]KAG6525990.1 hypothetical protein ZIOFF_015964 [Zingiber officinale]
MEQRGREESGSAVERRRYRRVRRRKWGRWVSEIRRPNSRARIWLESYDAPEKAARAFDAGSACLRGRRACLNFLDDAPAPQASCPGLSPSSRSRPQQAATPPSDGPSGRYR